MARPLCRPRLQVREGPPAEYDHVVGLGRGRRVLPRTLEFVIFFFFLCDILLRAELETP